MTMDHLGYLEEITKEDLAEIRRKEATYMGSWKKRGGIGAYFITVRKYDRLEEIARSFSYDIFAALTADLTGQDGSALAELRDLRRYLLLIESEMIARAVTLKRTFPIEALVREPNRPGTPDNGGHHSTPTRLDDGLQEDDVEYEMRPYYMIMTSRGQGYHIVDRRKTPIELWEHLAKLRVELNNTEYEQTLPEYQGLYRWIESESKWRMRGQYQTLWGK